MYQVNKNIHVLVDMNLLISSTSLGAGWRLGFHGLLHLDIFKQRLEEAGIRYTLWNGIIVCRTFRNMMPR